ncbi:MAG: PD-(D/E)XK nuclease family protein [Gemmatimonadetes bacterium]|nr:PD-(D/E)XK nuclease family protein [Gemmatimonadota bacterium]
MPDPRSLPYTLLTALAAEADRSAPGARTLLVAPTRGEGREILRALARSRGGWLGLEVTTVRPLALELVGSDLAARGLTLLDEFAEQSLIDELLDEALEATPGADSLRELAESVGFRAAVRDAVGALRLAGVDARRLASAAFADRLKRDLLVTLLARYEERLEKGALMDTAAVLRAAADAARRGALPTESVLLVPGLGTRGLAGRFLAALEARGARRLPADSVPGMAVPEGMLWEAHEPAAPPAPVEQFHAAGVTEELREVLRRVLARKLRWDQVEIVTTDAGVYGPALHALAEQLDVPVTFAVGLPVERTRAGRAVAAYLRWLEGGFPDAVLRRLLEGGDLAAPAPHRDLEGPRLARALRRLRIGWGRERYLPALHTAIDRLLEEGPRQAREEDADDAVERHERRIRELEALVALLEPILTATPEVPDRHDRDVRVRPSELARGLGRFLAMVPGGGPVDATALERLGSILDRIEATLERPTLFPSAVSVVTAHLAIRIPAQRAEGRAPWGSAGGHLHLSDVEHGGWSGRQEVFVVGLDAGRFPGQGTQDPVLLDHERGVLAPRDLPDSGSRLDERRFRMGALLARLRGRVTMSYAAWEPAEGRTLAPSSLLLEAFRAGPGGPTAGYEDLDESLGDPISRIPRTTTRLDREDVWLAALARGGHLLAGEDVVRAAFPALDRGLVARAARDGGPSAFRGLVAARPELDPRDREGVALSASRLEALGSCGLRYFYASVLRVRPPDDPALDPERWLDALRRGTLLHSVYDRLLDEARAAELDAADAAFADLGSRILVEEAEAMRREVPPPSDTVWRREMDDLQAEVRSFVGMIREERPAVEHTELRFGLPGAEHAPVELTLPSGRRLWLRGSIDRVDRLRSGGLRVVDYKTGSNRPYSRTTMFRGGRRLQHALYSAVAEALLDGNVELAEYHFPTRKGENHRSPFHRLELTRGLELLDRLLDMAAAGRFLPTDDPDDCFICDFKTICRAYRDKYGTLQSPPAEWGKAHYEDDAYDLLRIVRGWS